MISVISVFLTWFFAVLFIFSGALKLRQLKRFQYQIEAFNVVPYKFAMIGAIAVPSVELLLGVWLAISPNIVSALISVGLLSVFTVFIILALLSNRRSACFCFGESDGQISKFTLIRNGLLLVLAAGSALLPNTSPRSVFVMPCAVLLAGSAVMVFIAFFQLQSLIAKGEVA